MARTNPPPAPGIRDQSVEWCIYYKATTRQWQVAAYQLLFLGYLLLAGNRLTFAFPGTAVGPCTLTTNRQTLTMTQPTVTGNIQQTLDVHLHLGTKRTFHLELIGDDVTDGIQLIVIPLMHLLVKADARLVQDILGSAAAYTEYIGKSDLPSLVFW